MTIIDRQTIQIKPLLDKNGFLLPSYSVIVYRTEINVGGVKFFKKIHDNSETYTQDINEAVYNYAPSAEWVAATFPFATCDIRTFVMQIGADKVTFEEIA